MSNRRIFLRNSILAGLGLGSVEGLSRPVRMATGSPPGLRVDHETDICVLGGSCTGVFAAIRASRLGARVTLIEKNNAFGGVATNSLVFVWHSLKDTEFKKQIIAGLTLETVERLKKRDAVTGKEESASKAFTFNSQELKIELDEMVSENGIRPMLHTLFSEPVTEDGKLVGIVIENKDGRSVIRAKQFIDATGDGDLAFRLGLPTYASDRLLPPTTCAHIEGYETLINEISSLVREHGGEFNLPEGFLWGGRVPGSHTVMVAGTRVYDADCSVAGDLTRAEMEGRRQVRAILDIIRKYRPDSPVTLTALPSHIGIRQTRQVKCQHRLTGEEVLNGTEFEDAIAYGSYRVDIHHQEKPGITFKYLDGTRVYQETGKEGVVSRWREERAVNPTFYQVPFRSIVPGGFGNLLVAGRMLDADLEAFSGVRVMVNMNQLGEAAGTAAYLALNGECDMTDLDVQKLRREMNRGGSVLDGG